MRLRTRTWFALSFLFFAAAAYFWHLGNQRALRMNPGGTNGPAISALSNAAAFSLRHPTNLLSRLPQAASAAPKATGATNLFPWLKHRLANTSLSVDALARRDDALLLRNALIDTASGVLLEIPAALRAQGDPGSYIVQAPGPITDAFRAELRNVGATIVSYVPNNALLVEASAAAMDQLRGHGTVQAIEPYQPYYKLEPELLARVLEDRPLPEFAYLTLLVFPGQREAALSGLEQMGTRVIAEETTPFGPLLMVWPRSTSLVPLAQMNAVQGIAPARERAAVNDITRVTLGVSTNAVAAAPEGNWLGLTGNGVLININDTGVDETHPDLTGRVFAAQPGTLVDPVGHGTHVAGTIAGDGTASSTVPSATSTNSAASGSTNGANFRGMAPAARLFALPIRLGLGPLLGDSYLQETAARTNAFISNNSWTYAGDVDYDIHAASYDAAVRDALPSDTGSQPLLMVFAAGNGGGGGTSGQGGRPNTILSPATAKNVITVGASEIFRNITNEVVDADGTTNQNFRSSTDSRDQVAFFSSRGNVGPGREGDFGRFKPDVVAPGTMIVSARSSTFVDPSFATSSLVNRFPFVRIAAGATNENLISLPPEVSSVAIVVVTNSRSASPFPDLPIHALMDSPPTSADFVNTNIAILTAPQLREGLLYYSIGNPSTRPVDFDLLLIITVTNSVGDYFTVSSNLNANLGPNYRYESGTSMAAGSVSGVLGLMQEFFEQRLARTNSPALMKALLINGARSLGVLYDVSVRKGLNHQGWGLVNIRNSIPALMDQNPASESAWPVRFIDQNPTNALTTGESQTRFVTVAQGARFRGLRFTLVWTDPPGNPVVGTKLVNDLDLIVTNLITGEVYVGNNIADGSDFSEATTNLTEVTDLVNNVENVFLRGPVSAGYSVTVRARRVNVNAVTSVTNGILQDYALVVSSSDTTLSAPLTLTDLPRAFDPNPLVANFASNAVPLLNRRIGANSPYLVSTNGNTNQWNFFVFTNSTSFTNVAIVTFLPPNLSRPRNREADLDLYVSQNPALTNLDVTAVNQSDKSLTRGGTEFVIYTNATAGASYYIGVKSEDQQAANYGILAVASENPFSQRDTNGNIIAQAINVPALIPDGSPDFPGGVTVIAFSLESDTLQRVVVTNTITHEEGGDLLVNLSHGTKQAVLLNHQTFNGTLTRVYDDTDQGDVPGAEPTDGPGSLRDFVGEDAQGAWILTVSDNALFHTGLVENLTLRLEPVTTNNAPPGDFSITRTAQPGRFITVPVNVPLGATNMTICISSMDPPDNLQLYVRQGDFPTATVYDQLQFISTPGGCLQVGLGSTPPLSPGRYFIGVFNPGSVAVTFQLTVTFQYGLSPIGLFTYVSTNLPLALIDDAITNSIITVTNSQKVVDVKVGVRIDHPRIADLVLHLVSPQGTRVLLAENRGGPAATNYGFNFPAFSTTNPPSTRISDLSWVTFTESTNLAREPLKFAAPPFQSVTSNVVVYVLTNGFEQAQATNYTQGDNFEIWTVLTNGVGVVADPRLAHAGTNFLVLSDGSVGTSLPTVPDRSYVLNFAYRNISSSDTQEISFAVSARAYLGFPTNALPSSEPPQLVPKLRLCAGQQVEIISSNCVVNGVDCVPAGGTPGAPLINGLPAFALIGQWSRSPYRLETNTVWGAPFFVGSNSVLNAPAAPGDYYLFLGVNDGDFTDNFAAYRVAARWQNCQLTTFDYVLGTATNTLFAEPRWLTNTVVYTGNLSTSNFVLQAGWNFNAAVDSVEITEPFPSVYYLPEEPLRYVENELAVGDWRLEVWDTRRGPDLSTNSGLLLGWYLQMQFAPAPAATPLTNDVRFDGVVVGDQIRYFTVNVPRDVTRAVNILTGAGVELLYSRTGVPAGLTPPDPLNYPLPNPLVLTTNNPVGAELEPGGRYFLGVRNINPASGTNAFTLQVNFDYSILSLANRTWFTNTLAPINQSVIRSTNVIYPGTNMQYYRFDVANNSNTTAVTFELAGLTEDVNLVVRRALPVVDYLPTPTLYDYQSVDQLKAGELIIVRSNSFPVALTPGPWLLGVYNVSETNATYAVRAVQWLNTPTNYTVLTITNEGIYPFFVQTNSALNLFYRAVEDQTNRAALFEIFNLTGDADLLVRRSDLPSKTLFDFSQFEVGPVAEQVVVRTNLYIPHLNATNFFLTVVNPSPFNPVAGLLRVSASNGALTNATGIAISTLSFSSGTNAVSFEFNTLPGQRYEVQSTGDFNTWNTVTNIDSSGRRATVVDAPVTPTERARFYRVLLHQP